MPRRKKVEQAYPIRMAEDAFAEGNAEVAELLREVTGAESPRVALVADANVVQRTEGLGRKIGRYFQENGISLAASPVVIQGGEKAKADGFQNALLVARSILSARVGVGDAVVALGGGTILDIAGWAAAQVRGGVEIVRIPTTVASMLDGAFATTAAIDGPEAKDGFRVRSEPAAVVLDPLFANTVLDGVWCAGFGEAVRYAAVCDAPFMKRLAKRAEGIKSRDPGVLRDTISECVASRGGAQYVPFAQWCAARLEEMSGYKLPHGYAVAIAICVDCAYAVKKGYMKEGDQELVCRSLAECGALDGLQHSQHLLSGNDRLMKGFDSWALSTGSKAIPLPGALGKSVMDDSPDSAAYAEVLADFLDASRAD